MSAETIAVLRHAAASVGLAMRCPVCSASMGRIELQNPSARACCDRCAFIFASQGGIWRALAPVRELYFRRFAAEYAAIRAREGRGANTADYYLALPFRELTGHNAWQWRIRARTFRHFQRAILPLLVRRTTHPLRVLDLGAGNGWLSYRLSQRGHECVAVDLLDNALDGLGAARHYFAHLPGPFACVQAEMDNLPFAAAQFDLAIFNASFHYSEDYARTLREALRCLRPGGEIVILDTPLYFRDDSGRAMVLEKHAAFAAQHGFRSDSLRSREYLTPEVLCDLERACGLRWRVYRPWYGLEWSLRPLKAKLKGRREPSKFWVFAATVPGS